MVAPRVIELGADRFLLDLGFRDVEGLVAAYLVPTDGGYSLIETGPASCRRSLHDGIARAGVEPTQIRRILVTHIHLDHAGGLGVAASDFPKARLYVHREGVAHMIDPTRLIASARRAWGTAADSLWGPIVPVPADRISPLSGGESLTVDGGDLTVIDTPGHARHHLAFHDTATNALFTGDAAGVRLEGADVARPALPPPDLDVELLLASVDRMWSVTPSAILYSHFGQSETAARDLQGYKHAVRVWRDAALAAAREAPTVEHVTAALRRLATPATSGRSPDAPEMISGVEMAAQGLLRYFRTHGEIPEGAV